MVALQTRRDAMTEAALSMLESLDPAGRAATLHPLEPAHHWDWHYVPRSARPGLPIKRMTPQQRELVFGLLGSALSARGVRRVREILLLEGILGELTGRPDFRDPENYALAIFGDPARGEPWAWRFEGHHISVTFTVAPGTGVAVTPAFFGANPATVPADHEHAGLRALALKQDLGFELLHGLSASQRDSAILQPDAFRDILTGPGREASLHRPEGLSLAEMTATQRDHVIKMVDAYIHNMRQDLAERALRDVHDAGIEKLHFSWAGAETPGTRHYYRLHGPTMLIEYDNTEPNHTHTVWHNPRDKFGEDLLRRHYDTAHH